MLLFEYNVFMSNQILFIFKIMLFLQIIVSFIALIVPLLVAIAYFTLYERHILAALQRRQGPNIVGFFGLFQPLADGLKLFIK